MAWGDGKGEDGLEELGLGASAVHRLVQILPWREPSLNVGLYFKKCRCCVGAVGTSGVWFSWGFSHHPSAKVVEVSGWLRDLAQTCTPQERALGSQECRNACRRKLVLDGDISSAVWTPCRVCAGWRRKPNYLISDSLVNTFNRSKGCSDELVPLCWLQHSMRCLLLVLACPFLTWPFFGLGSFVWLVFCFYWTVQREQVPGLHSPLFVFTLWFLLIMEIAHLFFWFLHPMSVVAWIIYFEEKIILKWPVSLLL